MTRLDQNRAKAQLAAKSGRSVTDVTRMTIWGNHSATQYPDVFRARIGGRPAAEVIADDTWVEKEFIPAVQQRGAAVIEARGASSAASAASAAVNHVHDWMLGTQPDDWVSMAIPSDGAYGVPDGLISSFPVTTADGHYRVVPGLDLEGFSRARIDASVAELQEERDAVQELGLLG
jgi:malate dehydrogenase